MKSFKGLLLLVCIILSISLAGYSQIRLPKLISNGMVLQRDTKVKVWGWASADEDVKVMFKGATYQTKADGEGNWSVLLPAQKSGGPFEMTLKGKNEINIVDILFGDVWVCSGQSNMELMMERVKEKYGDEIEHSENKNIRQFLVPDKYDFKKEHKDLDDGSWIAANPKTVLGFSAVAYFFAKEIYSRHHIPIGLINAALGGSPVEAWMSEDVLIKFPDAYNELQRFKDDQLIEKIEASNKNISTAWYHNLSSKDKGLADFNLKWSDTKLNDDDWNEMTIPGSWTDGPLGNVNGSFWFRKKINIPESLTGKPGKLWMGRIVDQDSVFLNGKLVGTTGYQYPPRRYQFDESILKSGENDLAVHVINSSGKGGFILDKPYYLAVGKDTIDLKGKWKYKLGTTMPSIESQITVRWKPSGLYNKMISPLLNYSIKGVIWYQGESNASNPEPYAKLFSAMINDWRQKWNQGDFPFLYVQLANFMEATKEPVESDWAQLREAQRETLAVPNTRMVVTIDLGEWNDIHPLNKEDVGKRLSIVAEKLAYGNKSIVESGPSYRSMKIKGSKIIITFDNAGGGLISKGSDKLNYFSIAGTDKKFVWAKATIKGDKITLWNENVEKPVAVRYAWADNPEGANLYNKEGLPASPFEAGK